MPKNRRDERQAAKARETSDTSLRETETVKRGLPTKARKKRRRGKMGRAAVPPTVKVLFWAKKGTVTKGKKEIGHGIPAP